MARIITCPRARSTYSMKPEPATRWPPRWQRGLRRAAVSTKARCLRILPRASWSRSRVPRRYPRRSCVANSPARMHSDRGVMSREELVDAVEAARRDGERIVFTNGCFDISARGTRHLSRRSARARGAARRCGQRRCIGCALEGRGAAHQRHRAAACACSRHSRVSTGRWRSPRTRRKHCSKRSDRMCW